MYDAIVVGARVAGAPAAMLLARQGYRVLLVDRATFPSDTMSTHYIQQDGVRRLKEWGLLDRIVAAGTPPIDGLTMDLGPFALPTPRDPNGLPSYCPRRTVLDTILVDAAVEAGAELREGFTVQEVPIEGGKVTGIRGRDRDGREADEHARVVVGADGKYSLVARAVQPEEYNTRPALGCGYYGYWSGVPLDRAEIYLREGCGILLFPTNNDEVCVAVEWRNETFHEVRRDIEGSMMRALALIPGLAERIQAGRRTGRLVGTADLANYFRKPYGPGWALVGDAGYHRDPITGLGISDAFRDAELLAGALDAGFSGREPLEQALAGYEQQRNAAAMPMYEVTCALAEFRAPGPELFKVFGIQAPAAAV